jgi:HEAT repeat protein
MNPNVLRQRWRVIAVGLLASAVALYGVWYFCVRRPGDPAVWALLDEARGGRDSDNWRDDFRSFCAGEPVNGLSVMARLARMGPGAVDTLLIALKDSDFFVRGGAAYALGMIRDPRAVAPLVGALKNRREPSERRLSPSVAAISLGMIGDGRAVPHLMDALQDKNYGNRGSAAFALGLMGPKAEQATPVLAAILKDTSTRPPVRRSAITALARIAPPEVAIPPIRHVMETTGDDLECFRSGRTLAKLGDTENLLRLLHHKEELVRLSAAVGLACEKSASHKRLAAVVVPVLVKPLQAQDIGYLDWIVEAISALGPEAKDAVPALVAMLRNTPNVPREAVARALGQIGPEAASAVPALVELAKEEYSHKIGPDDGFIDPNNPMLVELLKGQHEKTRAAAVEALKKIQARK